jgi:hypothetical protein
MGVFPGELLLNPDLLGFYNPLRIARPPRMKIRDRVPGCRTNPDLDLLASRRYALGIAQYCMRAD